MLVSYAVNMSDLVMLAKKYDSKKHDPVGWLMSFKIDGIRAYWNGENLLTRGNNIIHAPVWFTKALEGIPHYLDGELVFTDGGSPIGNFQETCSVVKRHMPDERWAKVKYFVFDIPNLGTDFTYDLVNDTLKNMTVPKFVEVIEQVPCKSKEHLEGYHDGYTSIGGEGIMLRKPTSLYERKRSNNILKVKIFTDAEATVIDYEAGKGRHEGRLGGYICTWTDERNDRVFHVGTGLTDAERDNPLPVGSVITFEYFGLTNAGSPRHPKYLRQRLDYE